MVLNHFLWFLALLLCKFVFTFKMVCRKLRRSFSAWNQFIMSVWGHFRAQIPQLRLLPRALREMCVYRRVFVCVCVSHKWSEAWGENLLAVTLWKTELERQSQNIWDSKVHLKPSNRTKKPETGGSQEKGERESMKPETREMWALQHKRSERDRWRKQGRVWKMD